MLVQRFEDIARMIEDSRLVSYTFENKLLRFQLFHPETSRLYTFTTPTDTVHGRTITSETSRSSCKIRLIDLKQRLRINHDRYFPPADSPSLLRDARERVTLAYGRRSVEHRWLLNLEGEYPLLSCLLLDTAMIAWDIQ
jgi:hypothetical protein